MNYPWPVLVILLVMFGKQIATGEVKQALLWLIHGENHPTGMVYATIASSNIDAGDSLEEIRDPREETYMPTIEFTNGDAQTIDEPSTASGVARRLNAAQAEGSLAKLKDQSADNVYVNPSAVRQVY